jgi:hypothetical protein
MGRPTFGKISRKDQEFFEAQAKLVREARSELLDYPIPEVPLTGPMFMPIQCEQYRYVPAHNFPS